MTLADTIKTDALVLRRYRDADADDVAAGCDDPLTQRFLPLLPSPYTRTDALWWINEGSRPAFAAGGGNYAIADAASDRLLGGVGIAGVRSGAGEIGYWVAPWARGRGVASAATRALAAHAFSSGVARLVLRAQLENTASQRVALAAGFVREGVARGGGASRGSGRHDLVVWARLAADSGEPTKRLLPDLPGRAGDGLGELTDGVVTLRPLVGADADDTFALRILDDVFASSVPPARPARAAIERTCATAQSSWLAGERADFTIRDTASGRYAGEIGFYYFEPPTQQAMIGYSIAPQWRGMGFATRAAKLVTQWGFEQVGVVRVIAGTSPENLGSQRVLERAGFTQEGYQRARLPGPDGTRIDDLIYARVAPEFA